MSIDEENLLHSQKKLHLDQKKLKLDHAWRYFELHANQRISLFRYYILFFSIFATASGYLIVRLDKASNTEEILLFVFSFAFVLITLVFWFIDSRNRFLIKLSERFLRKIESEGRWQYYAKIFTLEEKSSKKYFCRHTCCFRFLYGIAIATSISLAIYSVYHLSSRHDSITFITQHAEKSTPKTISLVISEGKNNDTSKMKQTTIMGDDIKLIIFY